MQNIPGKNLIAMFFFMFTCDIIGLLLTLTRNTMSSISCRIVAVSLHFFSLALCTWPCVIAYDFWSIIQSKHTSYGTFTLYLRYSLFAWGTPILAISVCVLLSALSGGILIGYGKLNHFWIWSFSARLFAYIVSFSIMTSGSFALIFKVISHTKREKKKESKHACQKRPIKFLQSSYFSCLVLPNLLVWYRS